jgi:hypothetical protein
MGLKLRTTQKQIAQYINQEVFGYIENYILDALRNAGKQFVDDAKSMTSEQGSFKNHTYDLRSSIGYYIIKGRTVVESYFSGNSSGKEAADNALKNIPKRNRAYQLIGISGMFYSIYVISVQANVALVNLRSLINRESVKKPRKSKAA